MAQNFPLFPLARLRPIAGLAARNGGDTGTSPNGWRPTQPIAVSKIPLATYALLAVNIGIFLVMVLSGVGWINPDTEKVLHWGADYGPLTFNG